MSKSAMIDFLIHNLGFEHPQTIGFARYCDHYNRTECEKQFTIILERVGLTK